MYADQTGADQTSYIGEVKKEQAVLPSKMTLLIRASGVDGSPEELPGEIQFRLTGDRGLTFIEK